MAACPVGLLIIAGFLALGGLFGLARAYYEGTSMLLRQARWSEHRSLAFAVVVLPYLLVLSLLSKEASLSQFKLSGDGALMSFGMAAFVGWGCYRAAAHARPLPATRGYLMVIGVLGLFCFSTRLGISFASSHEDGYYEDASAAEPQESRNRALFNFLLSLLQVQSV